MSRPVVPAAALARSGFVTVLGAISLGMAAIGVFSGLVQAALLGLTPGELVTRLQAGLGASAASLPALPPALSWPLAHLAGLNALGLLLSAAFLAVSWGLLQRRNWARLGFIAFLLLGVLLNLGGLAAMWQMQQWILEANAGLGDPALQLRIQGLASATMGVAAVCTLLLAVLHFWLIQRLRAPAVRAEFGLDRDQ